MGAHVLTNGVVFVDDLDASGFSNEVRLQMEAETKECTTYASAGSKEYKAGLRTGDLDIKGLWEAGSATIDPEAFANLGTADKVATWCQTGVAGDAAYFGRFTEFGYGVGDAIGELAPFSLSAKSTNQPGVVRGALAKAKGNVSGTGGMGSVVQLGAVSATQYLYAAVHIFSAGTTITMTLGSDDNAGFLSGTTRATIGPLTTAGGTFMTRVAGPITDDYFLFNVTVCTGTFSIAAAFAVQ